MSDSRSSKMGIVRERLYLMLVGDVTQWAYGNQGNDQSFEQHVYGKRSPKKNASAYESKALNHNQSTEGNTEFLLYRAYFLRLALESMAIRHAWVNPERKTSTRYLKD